jgi:hypothetical protein
VAIYARDESSEWRFVMRSLNALAIASLPLSLFLLLLTGG